VLDVLVSEVVLHGARVLAVLASLKLQAWRSMKILHENAFDFYVGGQGQFDLGGGGQKLLSMPSKKL
jgi:hypothetical protein